MKQSDIESLIYESHQRKLTLQEMDDLLLYTRKLDHALQSINTTSEYMQRNHYWNYESFYQDISAYVRGVLRG